MTLNRMEDFFLLLILQSRLLCQLVLTTYPFLENCSFHKCCCILIICHNENCGTSVWGTSDWGSCEPVFRYTWVKSAFDTVKNADPAVFCKRRWDAPCLRFVMKRRAGKDKEQAKGRIITIISLTWKWCHLRMGEIAMPMKKTVPQLPAWFNDVEPLVLHHKRACLHCRADRNPGRSQGEETGV